MPDSLWTIILNYCEDKDKTELSRSIYFNSVINKISAPAETKKEDKIQNLSRQVRLLNDFISASERELATKTCLSHSSQYFPRWCKVLLFLNFVGVAILAGLLGDTNTKVNSLTNSLRNKNYRDNDPCMNDNGCHFTGACLAGCEEHLTLVLFREDLIFPTIFLSLTFLSGLVAFIYRSCKQRQQPQRFNDLPLSSYNSQTRRATTNLLSEFKGTLFNPFDAVTIESKMGETMRIVRQERDIRQGQLSSLTDRVIEVEDNTDEIDETAGFDNSSLPLLPITEQKSLSLL